MKKLFWVLLVGALLGGCRGDENAKSTAGISAPPAPNEEKDSGFESKLPQRSPDGTSELFKLKKKNPNILVFHEKWLVFTKEQYDQNPALYRKMWKDRKIQKTRDGTALKGLFARGGVLEFVIYDKHGVHLFSFFLRKTDI